MPSRVRYVATVEQSTHDPHTGARATRLVADRAFIHDFRIADDARSVSDCICARKCQLGRITCSRSEVRQA